MDETAINTCQDDTHTLKLLALQIITGHGNTLLAIRFKDARKLIQSDTFLTIEKFQQHWQVHTGHNFYFPLLQKSHADICRSPTEHIGSNQDTVPVIANIGNKRR